MDSTNASQAQTEENIIDELWTIPVELSNMRLDHVLSELLPEFSRSQLQKWVKSNAVSVNGAAIRAKDRVRVGDRVHLNIELLPAGEWLAEALPIEVVYEDDDILVVNKAVGMVVHPAPGHTSGTLVNALLHRYPSINQVPRAGIVHRLDKDTSGLMVVAKTLPAHAALVEQLQSRTVGREYEAIAYGRVAASGMVDEPIGRHPKQRKKMAVVKVGKHAITHYRTVELFDGFSHLRLKLETGRTHQIRVHMAHIQHSLVGDQTYGSRPSSLRKLDPEVQQRITAFERQALHAKKLSLCHPVTGKILSWEIDLASDIVSLIEVIRKSCPMV